MDTRQKLEALRDAYSDEAELGQVLDKLLDLALSQQRARLERYERELATFEQRYGLDSATFYRRFQAGEMGDALDLVEWAGLHQSNKIS